MLKNKMVFGCLAVLWGVATLAWAGSAAAGRPVLVVAETRHEFGTVIDGTTVSHEFVIANKGTEPLHILKIEHG